MRVILTIILMGVLSACASTPRPVASAGSAITTPQAHGLIKTPKDAISALPDRHYYHQQDPRWAEYTLGGSNEPLRSDGCLVTAAAMALSNLGFQTNPGDLVNRLKTAGGFNSRGWLVWSKLGTVTGGIASARFYKDASDSHVRACLADGFYPLVRFTLASRSTHWAVIVAEGQSGFYIRDPMVAATLPIPLASRSESIDAVRCVGVERV